MVMITETEVCTPCTLPHGRFVRGWSYGFLERLLGDLEQTGRADLQTRKERRREEQREPLTLVRLDLELVQLRVNAQHRRPYGSRAGVTQLDLLGHESPHAQDDESTLRLPLLVGRGGVAQGLPGDVGSRRRRGARDQPTRRHTHDKTHHDERQDTTYGRHRMFSFVQDTRTRGLASATGHASAISRLCQGSQRPCPVAAPLDHESAEAARSNDAVKCWSKMCATGGPTHEEVHRSHRAARPAAGSPQGVEDEEATREEHGVVAVSLVLPVSPTLSLCLVMCHSAMPVRGLWAASHEGTLSVRETLRLAVPCRAL